MDIKTQVEKCKTTKQVLQVIKAAGLKVSRDDSNEIGAFSIWLDDVTRIYKSSRGFVYQTWQKIEYRYSGIPTFFSTGL